MMQITGTLFAGVAVLAVAFELTWPATVFGAIGFWMISHRGVVVELQARTAMVVPINRTQG
jgi:hypothetical protein